MNRPKNLNYKPFTGNKLDKYVPDFGLSPYRPSPDLVQSVEIARLLGRPLLLRGEPGCGKTRLAEAVAYELHEEKYQGFFFKWPIKSTTTAQEGLYTFDHLARLRDIEAQNLKGRTGKNPRGKKGETATEEETLWNYIQWGKLGEAFYTAKENPDAPPPVLLVDEIDKADIDFPNDLLWEFEQNEFYIKELKTEIKAPEPPIVIITSNNEKELPPAFLRRCVFHFIEFPDDDRLLAIVKGVLEGEFIEYWQAIAQQRKLPPRPSELSEPTIKNKIITPFAEIRNRVKQSPNAQRHPSTSELLDWVWVVARYLLVEEGWEFDKDGNLENKASGRIISQENVILKDRYGQKRQSN